MILKYLGCVLAGNESENRAVSIAWSPNNLKLAVALADRSIYLFDETGVKKDRFSTKPVDSKYGKKSYVVKAIAFSPDSTKIAVGQTDNIVYVYKIGEDWGEKKVICNKFGQSSSVTCMIWPTEGPIIVGLSDGKVRVAILKAHKTQTLYTADAMTIALASNEKKSGFLSSHADGSIIRYNLKSDGVTEPSGRILTHGVPAYALAWPNDHICAGGSDKKFIFYDSHGKVIKTFDYSRDNTDKEITVACCSPSGQSVAIGSWNRIRIIDWSPRRAVWEETNTRVLPNFYTVTALAWRRDGSRLIIGGLCGVIEQFETVLKRAMVRGSHEVAYVGPSQVVVRSLSGSNRPVSIKSYTGSEIEDVRILGRRDNHIIARTSSTLLISDITLNLLSEIPWEDKSNSEKFFFEYPGVCLIFSSGELTIVEYGKNEILGSVRTEAVNPHVVSVRINERQVLGMPENKRLAYLLDSRTVRIVDLINGATISIIAHDARVDWLELSETGHRLLSRDKKARLWLCDDKGSRILLLTGTGFASWVPGSDVAVAQTGDKLAVWYNVDAPEASTLISIRGDAVDIDRDDGKTAVIVEEAGSRVNYPLDEGLIEFGTALHDNDFGRVILFLEDLGDRPEAEAMWENVARNAMTERKFLIAARCYAALGDVAYSSFLKDIVRIGEEYHQETGNDPLTSPECWAKLAILNGELKTAEAIYLEQNELDKALEMYQKYWHWEEALDLAENRDWPGLKNLKDKHLAWLLNSGQAARAAVIIESDDPRRAVKLFLDAGRAGRAGRLLLSNESLLEDSKITDEVVKALKSSDLMELAGEILEKTNDTSGAIKCYQEAGIFARALDLARSVEPNSVVSIEKDWGHNLATAGHHDAAINHFIEAGEIASALNSAINARQWRKALQIVQVIDSEDPAIQEKCHKLGEYCASNGDTNLAENLFLRAKDPKRAIEIHIKTNNWSRAYEVAMEHMESTEAVKVLTEHAEKLQESGNFRYAEALFVAIGEYDAAIAMYRRAGHRHDMIRLVAEYRPDLLKTTHAYLAHELAAAGKAREAEEHFIGAEDWRGAVTAYKAANLWEDALRVAKQASGDTAAQQVALMWARTLAPELGARLLIRLNYFDPCLLMACDANLFDWALEAVRYGTPEQQQEVHYKYAMALEDEGKFAEAEKEFIRAGKATEAVQMYIHTRDWDAAEEVAQSVSQEAVAQVLVARAAEAVDNKDYAFAESLLLRAHKPEIIIDHYKSAGMWSEAMRVCREYLPSHEAAFRRELTHKSSGIDGTSSLDEARRWLETGEVRTALDILIIDASRPALIQAADILLNQADPETALQVGGELGSKLVVTGEHALAAQVYLQADKMKEAINALVSIGDWMRARRIVHELAPDLESYLDDKYRESARDSAITMTDSDQSGRGERDADKSLENLARKGQWIQVFEIASTLNTEVLHKYLAQRAAQLLKSGTPEPALQLYSQYGAPPIAQYHNLYYRLAEMILNLYEGSPESRYTRLSQLRTFLLGLTKQIEGSSASEEKFGRLLQATHYSAVKCACQLFPNLANLVTKTSVSLLRYTDVLLADRCYYEAGVELRKSGSHSEAFVFLNHFLDLEECIEEGDGSILDVDDLRITDFPLEVPLPGTLSLAQEEREDVREWVLAVSMDQKIEQGLPVDQRGVYIGSLTCPANGSAPLQPCALTGYPIRASVVRFEGSNRVVDRDDWNKLMNAARQAPSESPLNDVLVFVQEWCGSLPSFTF
ncbi:intraflagellar transport protein 172 homolog [Microplitis demolitor]|uniref:intraflagellar transport protein 172 homolog n=1 Tax=Microplitis demolitor TaxID=69319 RepID=UPI0004CDBA39|nr:intraflagellar transport protein 172 homolog [Microplitis demolitor]